MSEQLVEKPHSIQQLKMVLTFLLTRKCQKSVFALLVVTLFYIIAFGNVTQRIRNTPYVGDGDHITGPRMQNRTYIQPETSRSEAKRHLAPIINTTGDWHRIQTTQAADMLENEMGGSFNALNTSRERTDNSEEDKDNEGSNNKLQSDNTISNDSSLLPSGEIHSLSTNASDIPRFINDLFKTNKAERNDNFGVNATWHQKDFKLLDNTDRHTFSADHRNRDYITSNKPVFIVVLGRMRTGSTVIGEMFNQNSKVGFIYEPLHALSDWSKRGVMSASQYKPISVELLRKLSVCEYPMNFISSIARWPTGGGSRSQQIQPVCAATSLCRRATPSMLRRQCLKYNQYRGVKTIRADLTTLLPLIEDDTVDVKILHLVRDPRATANSRQQVYSSEGVHGQRRSAGNNHQHILNRKYMHLMKGDMRKTAPIPYRSQRSMSPFGATRLDMVGLFNDDRAFPFLNTIPVYCKWLRSTITLAQQRPDWLQGRYKLLRYEDFADDPVHVTEDIYRYFGMTLPKNVRQWVSNNTRVNDPSNNNLYGSHRNSSAAALRWRTVMTSREAMQVEQECSDIMVRLGYRGTSTGVRLSDLAVSLLLPLPDNIPGEL